MSVLRRRWRWVVAAVALGLLVRWVGPLQLVETLRRARLVPLLLFIVGFALAAPLYGLQIWVGLRLRGNRIPLGTTVAAAVASWSVGTLTPARAGDLSLVLLLRGRASEADVLAVVVADKLISLSVLALLACTSAYALGLPYRAALLTGSAIAFGAGWALLYLAGTRHAGGLLERIGERWRERAVLAWGAMKSLLRPRAILTLGAISLARWVYICEVNLLIFMAFGQRPGFVHLVAGTSVGRILSLLPITVGGVGVKEPVQMVIYGQSGVPPEVVVAVSLVGMACAFLIAALWPLILRPAGGETARV